MAFTDILHHDAKDGVTGSCHQLLMDAQHSLLIDCWLFQGAEISADEGKSAADRLVIEFPWIRSSPAAQYAQPPATDQRAAG